MRMFNLFKLNKKKEIVEKKNLQKENIELIPNFFNFVSDKQFIEEISKYFNLEKYSFGISQNEEARIFIGNIEEKEIDFDGHILIVGNLKTKWVNLTTSDYSLFEGGGSLFVTGNIEAEYFSNDYNRLSVINGSLIIKNIINIEFANSCLFVNGDLTTEYFHGIDIGGNVKGKIEIDYGWGYCYDKENNVVYPKNDLETSLNFLKVDKNCDSERINGIIKEEIKTNAQQGINENSEDSA